MAFLTRLILAVVASFGVTLGLFILMQRLTASDRVNVDRSDMAFAMDFVRYQREVPPQVKQREIPQKPPPPKEPPPPPKIAVESTEAPTPQQVDFQIPNLGVQGIAGGEGPWMGGFSSGGSEAGPANSELVPIAQIAPQYPQKAALEGIEGFVRFEIKVGPDGTVVDASITEASDPMFRQAALRAIYRWKFRAKVVDGVPVETTGTYRMDFKLEGQQ